MSNKRTAQEEASEYFGIAGSAFTGMRAEHAEEVANDLGTMAEAVAVLQHGDVHESWYVLYRIAAYKQLIDCLELLLFASVLEARGSFTWKDIGAQLGIGASGAHRRFGRDWDELKRQRAERKAFNALPPQALDEGDDHEPDPRETSSPGGSAEGDMVPE